MSALTLMLGGGGLRVPELGPGPRQQRGGLLQQPGQRQARAQHQLAQPGHTQLPARRPQLTAAKIFRHITKNIMFGV